MEMDYLREKSVRRCNSVSSTLRNSRARGNRQLSSQANNPVTYGNGDSCARRGNCYSDIIDLEPCVLPVQEPQPHTEVSVCRRLCKVTLRLLPQHRRDADASEEVFISSFEHGNNDNNRYSVGSSSARTSTVIGDEGTENTEAEGKEGSRGRPSIRTIAPKILHTGNNNRSDGKKGEEEKKRASGSGGGDAHHAASDATRSTILLPFTEDTLLDALANINDNNDDVSNSNIPSLLSALERGAVHVCITFTGRAAVQQRRRREARERVERLLWQQRALLARLEEDNYNTRVRIQEAEEEQSRRSRQRNGSVTSREETEAALRAAELKLERVRNFREVLRKENEEWREIKQNLEQLLQSS